MGINLNILDMIARLDHFYKLVMSTLLFLDGMNEMKLN